MKTAKNRRRKPQPEILQSAIRLFGKHSFNGVTTRSLAKAARVQEPLIYAWFESKRELYEQAVDAVVVQAAGEFAKLMLQLLGAREEITPDRIEEIIRTWDASIPRESARLLVQVMLSDDDLAKDAHEPIDQTIRALARILQQHAGANHDLNCEAAATCLVRTLFWGKVLEGKSADHQTGDILRQWLRSLEPS